MSEKNQMLKILCNKKDCRGIVAYATKRGYVEVLRKQNRSDKTAVRITGQDYTVLANCHNTFCNEFTQIEVKNGVLNESNLRIKKEENNGNDIQKENKLLENKDQPK